MARSRSSTSSAAPRSDAYVGLLLISLLAQIVGVVFFYLDYSQYPEAKPQVPAAITSGGGGGAPAPAPVAPGGAPAAQGGAPAQGGPGGAPPAGNQGAPLRKLP
ncbi:MAG: hypothetical protein U0736_26985 [Gemmataceae bacterium]